MIIAVSGKGGTGKTLVSALLIKILTEGNSGGILAIDADPDSNLPEALGVEVEKTIGDIREGLLKSRDEVPPGMSWRGMLEYNTMDAMVEKEKFDLLVMGRPEGQGCYCAVNDVLRKIIDTFAKNYRFVVIDAEAGLEHLSRRTTQDVELMLVVTDPSKKGMATAKRIKELSAKLNIKFKDLFILVNRATPEIKDKALEYARDVGLKVIGVIPEDKVVLKYDFEGKAIIDLPANSKALKAMHKIVERLNLRNSHAKN
jgi:CO dehydrogenase maturation factor